MTAPDADPGHAFVLAGATLVARPSGALWRPDRRLLVVADLHLGKSERMARRGGALLPPYETAETLARLADEVSALDPARVICLGDSFDDLAAGAALEDRHQERLHALMAGRRWTWAEGNHDPGPLALGGEHVAEIRDGALVFRHAAGRAPPAPGQAEISGHHHPKARLRARGRVVSRPCFLLGADRLVLPAFGAYTGGLDVRREPLRGLAPEGLALLTGRRVTPVPLARL